jgi:hypothetical protein
MLKKKRKNSKRFGVPPVLRTCQIRNLLLVPPAGVPGEQSKLLQYLRVTSTINQAAGDLCAASTSPSFTWLQLQLHIASCKRRRCIAIDGTRGGYASAKQNFPRKTETAAVRDHGITTRRADAAEPSRCRRTRRG